MTEKRNRMIFDVPPATQMAIRLQAVKSSRTTGQVVEEAIRKVFPEEIKQAEEAKRSSR